MEMTDEIMSHNDSLVGRKGNISGKTDETSSGTKDENSDDASSSALVTLHRKSRIKTTVTGGPDDELSAVLQRRSLHLENWEFQTSNFGNSEADQKVFEYEKRLEEGKFRRQTLGSYSPVVVGEQLSKILQARKAVTDNSSSEIFSGLKDGEMDDTAKFKNVITSDYDTLKSDTKNTIEYQSVSTSLKASERVGFEYSNMEPLPEKSDFVPISSNVLLVSDLLRQRTQPVTSKEVEAVLCSSSLSSGLYRRRTELDSEEQSCSRGILKFQDCKRTPQKGILNHRINHSEDNFIENFLKSENRQSSEPESKNIHDFQKHDSCGDKPEGLWHYGIPKQKKEPISFRHQNLDRVALRNRRSVDRSDMDDITMQDASKVDTVFEQQHSEYDSISEFNETETDLVSIGSDGVKVNDTANEETCQKIDYHEDCADKEIHENQSFGSSEDVVRDSIGNINPQRPDIVVGGRTTEPTASEEIEKGDPDNEEGDLTPELSVTERVAALQKSSENWRHRMGSRHGLTPVQQPRSCVADDANVSDTSTVVRRIKLTPENSQRSESIANRLSLLTGSQDAWKSKVPEKDTKMFTVEGKMSRHGIVVENPFPNQLKRTIDFGQEHLTKIVSVEMTTLPSCDLTSAKEEVESVPVEIVPVESVPVESVPVKVEIPKIDEKLLDEFFKTSTETTLIGKIDVTVDDFDHIRVTSNDVLRSLRRTMPKRTKAGSRNPLKTMSASIAMQQEYTEEKSGIAEREFNRLKRERVVGTPQFAQEALAGLASKENFNKVFLRKAGSFHGTGLGEKHLPYKDVMLLRVKGRKWCQTRLVKPHWQSISSGDCFVLVTPDIVFLWIGLFSNVIERNKSSDVANQIWQRHDLGVRPASQLVVIDEEKPCPFGVTDAFWDALGADRPPTTLGSGHEKEDDWYEDTICLTNRLYRLQDSRFYLVPDYSGKHLRHEILKPAEVYVLDFGSEMYIWIGKQVESEKRRKAVKVAYEFWQKGYDYNDCPMNPLSSMFENEDDLAKSCSERPPWALFGKVNQYMETILFKEKFINWPDASRLIKVKDRSSLGDGKVDFISDLTPFEAKRMIEANREPVSTILEGCHIGRGQSWEEVEDGIKREFEIETHETIVWHITEFIAQKLEPSSFGQFHCEDTYVVRWKYSVHQIAKTLKGDESKQALTGRTRCAYFFWQGRSSSLSEKGASALMTVELDTERGPQIQIIQGRELPCFLNLFGGQMIVHLGRRCSEPAEGNSQWKQFVVCNELPNEICLVEIPVSSANLRSRASFLLLDVKTGAVFVWHGAKSAGIVRQGAKQFATSLKEKHPKELGLAMNVELTAALEVHEGSESSEFWAAVGGQCARESYGSLLDDPRPFDYSPRLFFMTGVSGTFEAKEIHSSVANDSGIVSAYPFTQDDLYIEEQPALFLLDNHHELFLWQGWWPNEASETEAIRAGSAETRFNMVRKCAMETAINYAKEILIAEPPPVYLVYAGCEPVGFSSLFPMWQPDKRVVISPTKKFQTTGSVELVSNVLARLSRKNYTFDELQQRPLPDGVNPLKLETYLEEEEFEKILGMKRKEFVDMPVWKQTDLKQSIGLF